MRANDDCIGSTIASVVELKSPNNPESKKSDPKEIEKLNAKSAIYRTVQKQHIRKLKGGRMWPALKSTLASAKKLESLIDKSSIKQILLLFRCVSISSCYPGQQVSLQSVVRSHGHLQISTVLAPLDRHRASVDHGKSYIFLKL